MSAGWQGWIKSAVFFALMFGSVCVAMDGAPIPSFVIGGGHSQSYQFDRIGADEVAWFRQTYGPNEIPSAPLRISLCETQERVDVAAVQQQIAPTPEPETITTALLGLAYFGIRRRKQ